MKPFVAATTLCLEFTCQLLSAEAELEATKTRRLKEMEAWPLDLPPGFMLLHLLLELDYSIVSSLGSGQVFARKVVFLCGRSLGPNMEPHTSATIQQSARVLSVVTGTHCLSAQVASTARHGPAAGGGELPQTDDDQEASWSCLDVEEAAVEEAAAEGADTRGGLMSLQVYYFLLT